MSIEYKLTLLKELCGDYGLFFADFTVWQDFSFVYIASHCDVSSYIERLSYDQLKSLSPRQIEEFVVECALTDVASNHGQG